MKGHPIKFTFEITTCIRFLLSRLRSESHLDLDPDLQQNYRETWHQPKFFLLTSVDGLLIQFRSWIILIHTKCNNVEFNWNRIVYSKILTQTVVRLKLFLSLFCLSLVVLIIRSLLLISFWKNVDFYHIQLFW